MPLRWTISHPDRLVTVTAEGFVALKELEEYYDAVIVAGAMPYAKLFDASAVGSKQASDEDFMQLGARMRAYQGAAMEIGPVAFVVTKPAARNLVRRCLNLAPASRPAQIFKTAEQARRWLDEQR